MKKSVLLAAGVCLLSGMTAFADPVTSVNAVGIVKVVVPASKLAFVGACFDPCGSTDTNDAVSVQDLFPGQLTGGTSLIEGDNIIVWDPVSLMYKYYFLVAGSGDPAYDGKWVNADDFSLVTNKMVNGQAFWVRNNHSFDQTLSLAGQVVDPASKTNSMTFGPGLTMFSYPFSASVNINSNELWKSATGGTSLLEGDNIITWNKLLEVYEFYWLAGDVGDPVYNFKWIRNSDFSVANINLAIGEGYWFRKQSSGNVTWNEPQPYSLK